MARKGRAAGRGPSIFLGLLTTLIAVLAPPTGARANGDPGGSGAPPAPPPLTIPASWYDTEPGASVDYLPASSSVTPGGQYTLSIPIDTPPARGMGPSLSFAYASTTANGLLGVGWSLGGLSEISRCRKTIAGSGANEAIHYTLTDDHCLDGQRLVLVNAAYSPGCQEYRTERDIFARIVGCGDTASGPDAFRVWTKGGEILLYEGLHHYPQDGDPLDMTDVIVAWPLRDAQDRSGNLVRYSYDVQPDSAAVGGMGYSYRPLEIEYTRKATEPPLGEEAGLRKVVFEYEGRADASNRYLGGIRYGLPQRLAAVTVLAPNPEAQEIVGRYELSYEESEATGRSLLTEIRRCDGTEGPERACLWAKQFTWWQAQRPDFEDTDVLTGQYLAPEVSFFAVLDANGDGRDDLLAQLGHANTSDGEPEIYLLRGSSDPDDHGFLPPILVNDPYAYLGTSFRYVDVARSRPADVDGDGSFELLAFVKPPPDEPPYERGFQWFRWSEDDLAFEPFGDFLLADGVNGAQLVDLEGDGLIDMLRAEPAPATPPRWLWHKNAGGDLSSYQTTNLWALEPGRAVGIDLDGNGKGELFAVDPVNAQDSSLLEPLGLDDAGQLGPLGQTWVVPSQGQLSIPPSFADVNGDGLRDALYLFQDPKQVRLNTGRTFRPKAPIAVTGQLIDTSVKDNGVRIADFDGDHREDILSLEAVDEVGQHVMRLWLSRPEGFIARDLGFLSGYKAPDAGWATTKLGDFNGDGWLDVVRMPAVTSQSEGGTTTGNIRINVLLQQAPAPGGAVSDLLYEVKDELGPAPRELVFYTTDWDAGSLGASPPATPCAYPQLCLRRGFPVVRMVGTTRIEPTVTRWTMYDYEDPRADLRGRGFLGFGAVRAFDLELRIQTRTTFDNHTRIGESYPFAGLPKHTIQIVPLYELPTDGSASPPMPQSPLLGHVTSIRHTYSHHVLNGGATYFTPVTAWSRTEFETDVAITARSAEVLGPNGAEERRTEGTLIWDAFGNPVYDYAFTWGGSARLTQHSYDNLTADWQIGLLRQSLESAGAPGALPSPREVTFDYDDLGRLARTSIEPNDPALRRRTVYQRNTDGLVEAIRESVSGEPIRATYFAYDDKERMFLRAAWNDLGHDRQIVTHPALGLPLVTQDENGVQVRRRYDTFGRVLEVLPDGGAAVEISYAADTRADPAHPHGLAITETSAGGATTTYVDERGRAKESATLAFDGQTIVHKTEVNAFGQPVRAHRPGFGAASSLFTETTFDTLGRATRVERPNGDHAETAYSMFEVIRWDFKQRPSILRLDQDGRVVESTRFLQLDHPITTRYEYGDFGFLTDVWDAEDNHTEVIHDRLGRRTVLDDPDQEGGEETTRYLQHDGLGSIALVFDEAGTVHDRRFFEPFGQRIEADGGPFTSGMAGVELGFTGHRHDAELGLIDMRGRVYDPLQKHFLTPDPIIGAPLSGQDLNRYAYVWNNPITLVDPTGLQEPPRPGETLQLDLTPWVNKILALFGAAPQPGPPPLPASDTQPTTPKADAAGASGPTGPTAQPAPQSQPPASEPKTGPPEDDYHGFEPYNRTAQRVGGYVDGLIISPVPFGPALAHALIDAGILPRSTPEFREGMLRGEMVGGALCLLWGGRKGPSAAPIDPSRPIPATAGGGAAPPLVVVPNGAAVVVGAGGAVNVAVAAGQMTVALSSGGGDGGSGAASPGNKHSVAAGGGAKQAGAGAARNNPEQSALIDMAKRDKRTGVSQGDAQAYKDLGKEAGVPVRGPEKHPGRPHGKDPHIHVGPVDHIPLKPEVP